MPIDKRLCENGVSVRILFSSRCFLTSLPSGCFVWATFGVALCVPPLIRPSGAEWGGAQKKMFGNVAKKNQGHPNLFFAQLLQRRRWGCRRERSEKNVICSFFRCHVSEQDQWRLAADGAYKYSCMVLLSLVTIPSKTPFVIPRIPCNWWQAVTVYRIPIRLPAKSAVEKKKTKWRGLNPHD